MKICVYAASSRKLDAAYYTDAYALGKAMAERGHSLVYGGGATGLMGSVARGVSENGGAVCGIAPDFFDTEGVLYKEGERTELILTKTMNERKDRMAEMADAFIALPGGLGTFDELFEVLTQRQLGLHKKPVALLNTLGYYETVDALLKSAAKAGFMKDDNLSMYRIFDSAEPILDYLEDNAE